jgi:hypothetical protein
LLNHQIARLRLLGIAFCLVGGAAITAGWAGTAGVACVDCQVPYLISGGAAGIALAVVGMGLLTIAQIRFEGARIAEQLATGKPPAPDTAATATADPNPTTPLGLAGAFPSHRKST